MKKAVMAAIVAASTLMSGQAFAAWTCEAKARHSHHMFFGHGHHRHDAERHAMHNCQRHHGHHGHHCHVVACRHSH